MWKAYTDRQSSGASPLVSLAILQNAGLTQGDGLRHSENSAIDEFIAGLIGQQEQDDPPIEISCQDQMTLDILNGAPILRTLSDAKDKHFELGKGPRGKIALNQFDRSWGTLLNIAGDALLSNLRREHANEFVRRLIATGVSGPTVQRYLSQVRPVINTAIREFELTMQNPFEAVTVPNMKDGPTKPRDTFTMAELQMIQDRCRKMDDERRWAIAMLSDTMARLAEVAGLRKDDVFLDAEVPHFRIQPTAERSLKTPTSARVVPLVGEALWAARRAILTPGPFLFPVFGLKVGQLFGSGSASAALNKWMKDNKLAKEGQTLHSFRHTMRDRLRNVQTPADLVDRIGGWKRPGVGESYGKGHELVLMQQYMEKAVRPVHELK